MIYTIITIFLLPVVSCIISYLLVVVIIVVVLIQLLLCYSTAFSSCIYKQCQLLQPLTVYV